MSNPLGDSASLYIICVFIALFVLFFIYRLYKCLRREKPNSPLTGPLDDLKEEAIQNRISSRNSSVDKMFNEFNHSINIKPTDSLLNTSIERPDFKNYKMQMKRNNKNNGMSLISQSHEQPIQKTEHINALLNLLAVKETGDFGLNEEEMHILKKNVRIFTHDDINSENFTYNNTGNIENLSKSFCLNNDADIRKKPSCMICLENLNMGDKIVFLNNCKHLFHDTCCFDWFSKKNYCPFCKKDPFSIETSMIRASNFI